MEYLRNIKFQNLDKDHIMLSFKNMNQKTFERWHSKLGRKYNTNPGEVVLESIERINGVEGIEVLLIFKKLQYAISK